LIFEIAVRQLKVFDRANHLARLTYVSRERLFARYGAKIAFARFDRVRDLFHIFEPRVIRPAQPKAIDIRRGDHIRDRIEGARLAHSERAGERGGFSCMLAIGTPHTQHVSVTHSDP
jgi:hypothetical protein